MAHLTCTLLKNGTGNSPWTFAINKQGKDTDPLATVSPLIFNISN